MPKIPEETISRLRNLSCEEVAEKLNMSVVKHKTLCFMHDDHHPSLAFRGANRERWFCFVCNKGGDVIQFVMEALNLSFVEACQWLGNNFGISVEGASHLAIARKSVKPRRRPVLCEKRMFSVEIAQWILEHSVLTPEAKQFLFDERKLSPAVVAQLGIVSISNSRDLMTQLQCVFHADALVKSGLVTQTNGKLYFRLFTPCLLFPYYNRNGQLVGLQSRYLGNVEEAPRFQFISNQRFRLFNLPILNTMKPYDDLYISEGITDCLALLSSGKRAVAVPSATILPEMDLVGLKAFTLHMYPDHDEAGRNAFLNLRSSMMRYGTLLHEESFPKDVKDYSDYYRNNYGEHKS